MKDGVGIVNCGGVIDEVGIVKALDSGKVLFAGLMF
jgi:D-3-phosphoglycerate dehydrogenase